MNDLRSTTLYTATARALDAIRDFTARALVALADWVTARSHVPNPSAAARLVQFHLADQNLSGADFYQEISHGMDRLGFTWPAGLCDGETENGSCNAPLTADEADGPGLCATCSQHEEALAA